MPLPIHHIRPDMKQLFVLFLALGLALPATAQLTVGGDANYSTSSEAIGGSGEVMYQFPLVPNLVYASPNARYTISESGTSNFTLNAEARVRFPVIEDVNPYLGVGYGYIRSSINRNAFDGDAFTNDSAFLLGGASYNAGNLTPYVQVRWYLNDALNDGVNVEAGARFSFRKTVD